MVLPDLYADAGFVPVARLKWNDDYAPAGGAQDTSVRTTTSVPTRCSRLTIRTAEAARVPRVPRARVYVVDYDDGIVSTRTDAGLLVTTTLCRS